MSHVLRHNVADQIAYFRAYNTDGSAKTDLTSATTGLTLSVFRVGASSVSIASLSNKAADNTAHADGAIRNVGGNLYTIDLPDAACATQVPSICVRGSYTGGVIEGLEHPIVAYDPSVVAVGANTTTPPTAAANATAVRSELATELGRIDVDISSRASQSNLTTIGDSVIAIGILVDALPTLAEIEATTVLAKEANATTNTNSILSAVGNIETGNGPRTITVNVTDGASPLSGALVSLTKGGVTHSGTTVSGTVTFNVTDGTWRVAIFCEGYSSSGADLEVNGDETETYPLSVISISASSPGRTTGYWTCFDEDGNVEEGASVSISVAETASSVSGNSYDSKTRTELSAANGVVQFTNMHKGVTYRIQRGTTGPTYLVTVPLTAGGSVALDSFIGLDDA